MKKSNIIACSLLLAGCFLTSDAAAANGPKEAVVTHNGETINLRIETKSVNNNISYNVMGNDNWIANSDQDCNINAYKIFYDAQDYCKSIIKSYDSDIWHKNITHYNSDSANADILIETLATSDIVIEGSYQEGNKDFFILSLLRTCSNDFLKRATGLSLIGATPQEVENILGKGQHITECDEPFMLYSFYVDGGTSRRITLYMNNGRISEVLLNNDAPGECETKCGEGCYYSNIPEGWYTKGTVTGTYVNVRAEAKTGEVIAKVGSDHPEMMFAEIKNTREEYPWVHIITKCDMNETHPDTIDGWVYGKYVSPSFKHFHLETAFNNSFEYFDWLMPYLGEPTNTNKTELDGNGDYQIVKSWADHGIVLTYNIYAAGAKSLIKAEITGEKYAFAGLKVGANIETVRKFNENLSKVNTRLTETSDITGNGIMTWKNADNFREVAVEATTGKVSKITLKY